MKLLNNELFKLARNYSGLNQKAFAEKIDISQSHLSQIEKGIKPLTEDTIHKLKNFYGETFFHQEYRQPLLKVYYRVSATIAKKYTDLFEARLGIISNNIGKLLERVEIPENKIPRKDLEEYGNNSAQLALDVRDYFGLGRGPIQDIISLLEKNGVIIYFYDYDFISAQNKNFDGVSFYSHGVPVILINDKIQNARKVLTIAHELGHLIMHNDENFFIGPNRDFEKEANVFASEFIAPSLSLRGEFTALTMNKLFALKSYWKLSAGALLYRAKEMVLSPNQYQRWMMHMAPYRKQEPNDIELNKPFLLKKMFEVFTLDLEDSENFNDEIGLSHIMFEEIYSTLIEKQRPKMKIMI